MDSGISKYLLAYYCFQAPSVVRTRHVPAFVVGQLLSHVLLFATPWTAAHQASLSFTISWNLLKLMSIKSVMPSNHPILCRPLLLLPSVFPSIRVFSSELVLHIKWPKYWCFSFSINLWPRIAYNVLGKIRNEHREP